MKIDKFFRSKDHENQTVYKLEGLDEVDFESEFDEIINFFETKPTSCFDLYELSGEKDIRFYSKTCEEGSFSINDEGGLILYGDTLELDTNLNVLDFIESNGKIYESNKNIKRSKMGETTRQKNEDFIELDEDEKDDDMVVEVKENLRRFPTTLKDIYDVLGTQDGYNLFYGLKHRNNMTTVNFHKWARVFNKEVVIKLK